MMKQHLGSHAVLGIAIALASMAAGPARSQIVPDATLPQNSQVLESANTFTIDGGTAVGGNLFHSFDRFDVPADSTALFNNAATVDNIITRVTGTSLSDIDGTIAANGTANLFLINPNGIQFGSQAALNIGGSFIATTADAIAFADGFVFDATTPQASPILTVSVPVGLQFGTQLGTIVNESKASFGNETNSIGLPAGLQVRSGNTLALIGGDLRFDGGSLTAFGGRIELGSVASAGEVSMIPVSSGWTFDYTEIETFGNIHLLDESVVDTSGIVFLPPGSKSMLPRFSVVGDGNSGDIQVRGGNVAIENSPLTTTNLLDRGGELVVTASSLDVSGIVDSPVLGLLPAGLFSETFGLGVGGDLTVAVDRLNIQNGAQISTISAGIGSGGDLTVIVSDFIDISGSIPGVPSALLTEAISLGQGGNLNISTRRLTVRNGGEISATTFGTGSGGNVNISDTELVEVVGGAGIFIQTPLETSGNSGNLTIVTDRLRITNFGQIASSTFGVGHAGNIIITAFDSTELTGAGITHLGDIFASSILTQVEEKGSGQGGNITLNTGRLNVENLAQISAGTRGLGSAGNVTLNVGQLSVRNGGQVIAGTTGTGNGGNIIVNASETIDLMGTALSPINTIVNSGLFARARENGDAGNIVVNTPSLHLDDAAIITAETAAGKDGNITIDTQTLQLRDNSSITTNATGSAVGGNIEIETATLAALNNSDITANAEDSFAGRVRIVADGIFLEGIRGTNIFREPSGDRSDITASSSRGTDFDGVVELQVPDIDPTNSAIAIVFPQPLLQQSTLCAARSRSNDSEFVNAGDGGVPPSPQERFVLGVTDISAPEDPLLEARGWQTGEGGTIQLVADPRVARRDRVSVLSSPCSAAVSN